MSNLTESNRLTPREVAIIKAAEGLARYIASTFSNSGNFGDEVESLLSAINLPDPTKLKKGQLVMVWDANSNRDNPIGDVFIKYNEGSSFPFSCRTGNWIHCRLPTEDEWKMFKDGEL